MWKWGKQRDKSDPTSLIKEISRVSLGKGDILVFKLHRAVPHTTYAHIKKAVEDVLKRAGINEVPVLVVENGTDITVVSEMEKR